MYICFYLLVKKYKKMFILTSFMNYLKSRKYQAKTEIISVVVVGSQHILGPQVIYI